MRKVWNKIVEFKDKLIEILSDFEWMWDGRLGQMPLAGHQIDLIPADAKPTISATYRAGPEVREFERIDIDKMLS